MGMKKSVIKRLFLLLSLVLTMGLLAACISVPLGDGNKLKISKNGVSFESSDGSVSDVAFDEDEGTVNFIGKDADGETVDFNINANQELPDDFPADFPIPEEAEVGYSSDATTDGERMIQVHLSWENVEIEISDYLDQVEAYLEKNGYEDIETEKQAGMGMLMGATVDEEESIVVNYLLDEEEPIVMIGIIKK